MKTQVTTRIGFKWAMVVFLVSSLAIQTSGTSQTSDSLMYFPAGPGDEWVYYTNIVMIVTKDSDLFVSAGGYLYGSTNSGTTWDSQTKFFDAGITTLGITDSVIFAAENTNDENLAYASTDNGATWSLYQPLRSQFVEVITVHGTDVFSGSGYLGIFRSTDNGVSWSYANHGIANGSINAIASSGNKVITSESRTGAIFLSIDQGSTWKQVDSAVYVSDNALTLDHSFALAVGRGIFRSKDGGIHWTMVDSTISGAPYRSGIAFCGNAIFVASRGVFVSFDSGSSWKDSSKGLFSQNPGGTQDIYPPIMCSLAASGTTIFAGTYGSGIFKSTDLGSSWTLANNGLPSMEDTIVGAMATCGKNIFAAVFGAGVYLSTDAGASWEQINNGLNGDVRSFAVSDTIVFAGSQGVAGEEIFIFRNANRNWISENEGLTNVSNSSYAVGPALSLTASNSELYFGTGGIGVWKRSVAEMLIDGIEPLEHTAPSEYWLYQNYPNPFNPTTTIEYQLPRIARVTIKVYDILGQVVETLVDDHEQAGVHTVKFNGDRLATSVYFYRLTAPGVIQVMKMLLLK